MSNQPDMSVMEKENIVIEPTIATERAFPSPLQRTSLEAHLDAVVPVAVCVRNLHVQFQPIVSLWNRARRLFALGQEKSSTPIPSFKPVLSDISADFPPGTLTAIIGASGSGKTTLLNSISNRLVTKKLQTSGTVTFNGNGSLRSVRSSYVTQQDILIPTLTVRETLRYAADLRLPSPSTEVERKAVVERVISELGLKECADTRIGTSARRGCSGGEKRRASVGVQMLANPSILFCDEPTTGLDSYSAFQVVETLKKLAAKGRTIVMSIHSPRSEIWNLFDRVILLSSGFALYSGTADGAISHFADCGYSLPPFVNPAEFLIDLAAIDNRSEDTEQASLVRVAGLRETWELMAREGKALDLFEVEPPPTYSIQTHYSDQSVTLSRQISILTRRSTSVTIRDPLGLLGSIFEAVSVSIISGWIFFGLERDLSGIRSREGAIYTASSLQGYLVLMYEIYRLTSDIRLFDREYKEGVVSIPAFLLSRRLSRLFLEDLPVPIIFTVIYYFFVGFRADTATFFIFLAIMTISQFITVTLAMLCVSMSRSFAVSSWIANMVYTLQTFCCGFFIQSQQLPIYVRWLKWTAYNFYTFGALASNEFVGINGGSSGQFYDCPSSNNPADPACQEYVGANIIESLGLPHEWIWKPIIAAIGFAIAFYLAAGAVLTFWTVDIDTAKARQSDPDRGKGNENSPPSRPIRNLLIGLHEYKLEVLRRHLWKKSDIKVILNPVTATLEPGKLNVIMGPSGSGKTSLLLSLAQRLTGSLLSQYHVSGHITFNGAVPSASVIRSVVSFVSQDDGALIPSLTVRETLRFAARLRLPSHMSKRQKFDRAEEVLLKMGLKHCADNVIGDELRKGISGGEKRRVSIAIQILTDPNILLLDEPTSGLDAFTARSVIEVIRQLANEGRTIVLSIHQTRSDIFPSFDNILLLARGGSLVYSGSGVDMTEYFAKFGFECPRTANPSDFVMDLITVDLQYIDKEIASREKVLGLIKAWKSENAVQSRDAPSSKIATPAELSSLKRVMNPFRTTFPLVAQRSAINIYRTPEFILARTMQVIGMTILNTLFFSPLKSNQEAVQSRMGFIQEAAALCFIGMLQNNAVYPTERSVYLSERLDNCYTAPTFVLSYTILELPFTALTSVFFGTLSAYVVDLKRTPGMLFVLALNCFCVVTCGESIGIMFNTFFNHTGFALNITCIVLTIATTMSGVISVNVPSFLQAWNHLSPLKYLVTGLASFALRDMHFSCDEGQMIDGHCPIETGDDVLALYRISGQNGNMDLVAVAICCVAYRVLAFLVVLLNDWRVRIRK